MKLVYCFSDNNNTCLMLTSVYEMRLSQTAILLFRAIDDKHTITTLSYKDANSAQKDYKSASRAWSKYVQRAAFGSEQSPIGYNPERNDVQEPDVGCDNESGESYECGTQAIGFI